MTGDPPGPTSDSCRVDDARVQDLPPSAKVVYLVLRDAGELTLPALRSRTSLPEQTLHDALADLREANVIQRRITCGDARYSRYTLTKRR
ncbi:ArsR family transcriptional regulator [Halobaculum sp. CBA1158]|uniref:ArsR family transcriptional regulator n=1 Tax=Halobaculum sp. CBA1158 TaxID=2904243 RepID=UPI001F2EBC6E|nr:ArsR family transcriptional regulator [Halobaculum sp. CBA1158]UIP00350.1 ArsR family transcriptional regulator [Halobaculum sp. CBA1158]